MSWSREYLEQVNESLPSPLFTDSEAKPYLVF